MNKININQKPDQSINITLNYPELRIDNPQESKRKSTNNLGKLIKATFIGKPNEPNVIYSKTGPPQNCQAQNLYIYGKLHDINVDYDGELIIQNQAQTTQQIIYTIFLLKTWSSIFNNPFDTTLDTFLKNPSSTTLDINSLINQIPDSYIVYSDQSTIVIIDTNVITIKTDLSEYTSQIELFNANPTRYSIVQSSDMSKKSVDKSVDKSVEGFSLDVSGTLINDNANGDYLVCDNLPIDSPAQLNYVIPGNSGIVNSLIQNSFLTTVLTYIFCFTVFLFVLIAAPLIYRLPFTNVENIFTEQANVLNYFPYILYPSMGFNRDPNFTLNNIILFFGWFFYIFSGMWASGSIIKNIFTEMKWSVQGVLYTSFFQFFFLLMLIIGSSISHNIKNEPNPARNALIATAVMSSICYLIGFIAIKNDSVLQTWITNGV